MKAEQLQVNDNFICLASGWFHPEKELGIKRGQVLVVKKKLIAGGTRIFASIVSTGKAIEIPFHCLVLKLIM
jgi:hypothetical protein